MCDELERAVMQSAETLPVDRIKRLRSHLHERMQSFCGPEQCAGLEIAALIRLIANQYEVLHDQQATQDDNLSGPRWGLLLRLAGEEERGNTTATPTYLSRCQNVSKNTISSLLRGLEDQGLIARELDRGDRRIFRIRLTPAGRHLIRTTAPLRIHWHNQLVAQLSPQEKDQLVELLSKLYGSITTEPQSLEAE
jgi:DNA-binding MarR family transcriptional regulator